MPITQEQLAKRLKDERKGAGLTQEEVAERLGIKRPTVAQIEAGNRAVTSIELSQIAVIYKRDLEYFLSDVESRASQGVMHLRASRDLDEMVSEHLEKCVAVCKIATSLERVLGISRNSVAFSYTIERPQARWDAVEQAAQLAAMERQRLNLGTLPLHNIVGIIARHGVRVARYTLTDDISGLSFVGPDTGMAIVVNMGHRPTRRLFSYAHEYAHLLIDSHQTPGGFSRFGNRDDLLEVRANTFAAHFLMPAEGVRAFFDNLGGPTRQVAEVYDGFRGQDENGEEELVTAQRRAAPRPQEVRMIDVLRLARHFGTSYEAAVYHLLNLKIIQKETQEKLIGEKERSEQVNSLLGGTPMLLEQEATADLSRIVADLVVEAFLQKQITGPKAKEYMRLIDLDPQMLDGLSSALSE